MPENETPDPGAPPPAHLAHIKVIVDQAADMDGNVRTEVTSTSQDPFAMLLALNNATNVLIQNVAKGVRAKQVSGGDGKPSKPAQPKLWTPGGPWAGTEVN